MSSTQLGIIPKAPINNSRGIIPGTLAQVQVHRDEAPDGFGTYYGKLGVSGVEEIIGGPGAGSGIPYGIDTNVAANVINVIIPGFVGLIDAYTFEVRNLTTNTGAVTLQIFGEPAKAVVNTDGTPLVGGELVNSEIYIFAYNLTNDNYELIGISQQSGWSLTGNNGTVDGVNFIGTTDNVPFNIRTNNIASGRIEPSGATANTFYGFSAGLSNTGTSNTALGWGALQLNTTGGNNTAIGTNAICCNVTGSDNTSIGQQALRQLISGSGNTAVGSMALNNNTASNNTAVGFGALKLNTSGSFNVAIGNNALNQSTTSSNNTAVGSSSLNQNTIGQDNSALGFQSLLNNTGGSSNTAIGFETLKVNTDGADNTAVGWKSQVATTTINAFRNTSVGSLSLTSNTTGFENTAIGYNSGVTNATGSRITLLGAGSNVSADGFTNATAIGYNAIVGASNALILGGTGGSSVNVGIGTITPQTSSILDLTSTTMALLVPRMTSVQEAAIVAPTNGMIIYNTDIVAGGKFRGYENGTWTNLI